MSTPRYSGTIEFPAAALQDPQIQLLLAEEGVTFLLKPVSPQMELGDPLYDLSVQIEEGIFCLQNPEARYGEFSDLEELLIEKGIPFDRESGMDWNAPPAIRIFRPGPPAFDHTDSTPDGYDEVVSMRKVREILKREDAEQNPCPQMIPYEMVLDLLAYLDEQFPTYPPLADFVKEEGAP